MNEDLNSLYNPWSREFGEYVIVFQVLILSFLSFFAECVSMLSFSKECLLFQNPTALTLLLFTSMNFDHTSSLLLVSLSFVPRLAMLLRSFEDGAFEDGRTSATAMYIPCEPQQTWPSI